MTCNYNMQFKAKREITTLQQTLNNFSSFESTLEKLKSNAACDEKLSLSKAGEACSSACKKYLQGILRPI